jgi:hypothetical protein
MRTAMFTGLALREHRRFSSLLKTPCRELLPPASCLVFQVNIRLPSTLTGARSIVMFVGNWLSEYFTVWVAGT